MRRRSPRSTASATRSSDHAHVFRRRSVRRGLSSFTVRRRSGSRGLVLVGLVLAASAVGLGAWAITSGSSSTSDAGGRSGTTVAAARPRGHPRSTKASSVHLVERRTGSLPSALQDPAPAALGGGRAMLLGGLTAQDTSTNTILVARAGGAGQRGRLPGALHDAAAVRLGRAVYLFGGGNGLSQLDSIVRVDPVSGATADAGRLPAPSSDQAAAAVGQTAYVVGGYTGRQWLDTIVAWRAGSPRSHRRAPALAGALRRGDGRGRPGRDRRRLSPERNGQRGGAGVLSGHWQGDEDRAAPRADDPCLGRGAGRCRLRDRRPRRRGRNSHGQGGRRRPPARAGPAVGPAREPALRSRGRRPRQRDPPRGRSRAGRHRVRAERARPHRRAGTRASRVSRNGFRYAEGQRLRLRRGEHARTGRPHRPATHLRAEQRERERGRDRPAYLPGRRALRGRRPPAARHACLRPEDALRHQRPRQQPDADRSADGQAGQADSGGRPLQHVLHSRRALRDRRRRAAAAGSTSGTRTASGSSTRSRFPVPGSTTWTSRPTAAT